MYYLKSVCGNKIRFESVRDIFAFFDNWCKESYFSPSPWSFRRFIGNSFFSKVEEISPFFQQKNRLEDLRNPACHIFNSDEYRYDKELRSFVLTGLKTKVLVVSNKFICLDCHGRVMDSDDLYLRFLQSYRDRKDGDYGLQCGRNLSLGGFKSSRHRKKVLNLAYSGNNVSKRRLVEINPVDEWDKSFPVRSSICHQTKQQNDWNNDSWRDFSRSWKSQSKKSKQWM